MHIPIFPSNTWSRETHFLNERMAEYSYDVVRKTCREEVWDPGLALAPLEKSDH